MLRMLCSRLNAMQFIDYSGVVIQMRVHLGRCSGAVIQNQ